MMMEPENKTMSQKARECVSRCSAIVSLCVSRQSWERFWNGGDTRAVFLKRGLFITLVCALFFYIFLFRAPSDFPTGQLVRVDEGMSLSEISARLKDARAVRSELVFESFVTVLAGDSGALSGEYLLDEPLSAFALAKRITKGEFGLASVRITITEGSTIYDIARLFEDTFPEFDSVAFLRRVSGKEGYLFPDTYLFLPNVKEDEVADELERTFERKVSEIADEVASFGKPLEDVVIMASILEEEARTSESRRIISGILWKRLAIGMPLQVDAVFPYINGKNTYELTLEDLKIDSPYNTYKYKGLPIGPIGNPGLDSLRAAINPTTSPYLYYLSDREGNMHYAKTFAEHKENKRRYLN